MNQKSNLVYIYWTEKDQDKLQQSVSLLWSLTGANKADILNMLYEAEKRRIEKSTGFLYLNGTEYDNLQFELKVMHSFSQLCKSDMRMLCDVAFDNGFSKFEKWSSLNGLVEDLNLDQGHIDAIEEIIHAWDIFHKEEDRRF